VRDGRARIGSRLSVSMPNGPIAVDVVQPMFFDPKGERIDA